MNLLMYMDFTILGSAIIVVLIENEELNKKCNKIINK